MALSFVLMVQLALFSPAWSQTCATVNDPAVSDSNPHFTIQDDSRQSKVSVIFLTEPPPNVRQAAIEVLRTAQAEQFTQRLRAFLVANALYVFAMRSQFNVLTSAVSGAGVEHLVIDIPPDKILQAERESWNLAAQAQGFTQSSIQDDVTAVLIIAVGPVMALRVRYPGLFIGMRLEGLPAISAAAATTEDYEAPRPAKPKRSRSQAAAAKYDDVMDQLSDSSRSRRAFTKMVRRLKSDPRPFGEDVSISETKDRLLQSFWRPAQKPIRNWLDAFYGEPSAEDKAAEKKTLPRAATQGGWSNYILGLGGSWLIYLPGDKYQQASAELLKTCNK